MEEVEFKNNIFDSIKHIDERGNEYWFARELQLVLEYKAWRKFSNVIEKAKEGCVISKYDVLDHFVQLDKMVDIGSKTRRKV